MEMLYVVGVFISWSRSGLRSTCTWPNLIKWRKTQLTVDWKKWRIELIKPPMGSEWIDHHRRGWKWQRFGEITVGRGKKGRRLDKISPNLGEILSNMVEISSNFASFIGQIGLNRVLDRETCHLILYCWVLEGNLSTTTTSIKSIVGPLRSSQLGQMGQVAWVLQQHWSIFVVYIFRMYLNVVSMWF